MRTLTLAEYQAEARAAGWRFVCPKCGNVAGAEDFAAIENGAFARAAVECIGRADPARGCDWAAFGLLGTLGEGVLVTMPDGSTQEGFAPAPARTAVESSAPEDTNVEGSDADV